MMIESTAWLQPVGASETAAIANAHSGARRWRGGALPRKPSHHKRHSEWWLSGGPAPQPCESV